MDDAVHTARRAGVVLVALASLAAGLALVWFLVDPRVIARVSTGHLVVMLGLFLLPAATFGAWHYERTNSTEGPEESPAAPASSDPVPQASNAERQRRPEPARVGRTDEAARRCPSDPPRHRRAVRAAVER